MLDCAQAVWTSAKHAAKTHNRLAANRVSRSTPGPSQHGKRAWAGQGALIKQSFQMQAILAVCAGCDLQKLIWKRFPACGYDGLRGGGLHPSQNAVFALASVERVASEQAVPALEAVIDAKSIRPVVLRARIGAEPVGGHRGIDIELVGLRHGAVIISRERAAAGNGNDRETINVDLRILQFSVKVDF